MWSTLHRCPAILSALVRTMSKDGCHVHRQYPEGFFPVSTFFNAEPFLYPQASISTSPVRAQSQRIRSRVSPWQKERRKTFFLWSNLYFDADQCMCASFCISKYTMQPIFTPNPSNPTAVLVSSPMLLSSIGTSLAQLLEVTLRCSSIKSKRSPGRRGRMDGPTDRL